MTAPRDRSPEPRAAATSAPGTRGADCGVPIDVSDPLLPVAGTGSLSHVRRSRRGRWRAGVLIGIHVLFLIHITHYALAGWSLSPVEPSESMYTLELGWLNAGFVFFALAILSTLLFGRFVCGWACHLVGLQDLCAWIMKRLGIRPRPFRSRLMMLAPFVLGFYMFFWPGLRRVLFGIPTEPFPGFTNHLITTDFWRTFPGPAFAILTLLTAGFAAVYVLGAKGFCAYGCPYGALFSAADRLSVGRILVNDACRQCGHCTATCTSNVRVHEEVRLYGAVVDPGCMKCTDCVSVCPTGALRFGFGKPSLFKGKARAPRARVFDLSLGEEILVGAVCLAATLAFRGLYDGPPLLMAIALGGITAFVALTLLRLARRQAVRVQNLPLTTGGRTSAAGWTFAASGAIWLAFAVHSGFVQWHRARGMDAMNRTEAARADVLSGAHLSRSYPPSHDEAVRAAERHLSIAERWGLFGVVEIKLGLAWVHLLRGRDGEAEREIREAVALDPENPELHQNLVELYSARGRVPEAIEALQAKIAIQSPRETVASETVRASSAVLAGLGGAPRAGSEESAARLAADRFTLGTLLAQSDRLAEAADQYAACVALTPDSATARFNYGGVLRRLGRFDEAARELSEAARRSPDDADTQIELGLALLSAGRGREAAAALRRAVDLEPTAPESLLHLPGLIEEAETLERGSGGGEPSSDVH